MLHELKHPRLVLGKWKYEGNANTDCSYYYVCWEFAWKMEPRQKQITDIDFLSAMNRMYPQSLRNGSTLSHCSYFTLTLAFSHRAHQQKNHTQIQIKSDTASTLPNQKKIACELKYKSLKCQSVIKAQLCRRNSHWVHKCNHRIFFVKKSILFVSWAPLHLLLNPTNCKPPLLRKVLPSFWDSGHEKHTDITFAVPAQNHSQIMQLRHSTVTSNNSGRTWIHYTTTFVSQGETYGLAVQIGKIFWPTLHSTLLACDDHKITLSPATLLFSSWEWAIMLSSVDTTARASTTSPKAYANEMWGRGFCHPNASKSQHTTCTKLLINVIPGTVILSWK